jgi:Fe2+ or Zn2+ uptake regulation protein
MSLSETAVQNIHARGGRITLQRQLILAALENLGGHPTAEEIYLHVRRDNPDINLSTIYRNLRSLESQGLISPRWFEEERRQQRFDPTVQTDHYHFRCRNCSRIMEFDSFEIDHFIDEFAAAHRLEISSATFTLYGLCPECQAEEKTK